MDLALGEDRCAQIRDMVNPDTMTSGNFTYEVQVFAEDTELITGRQAFDALDPEDAGGAAATDDAGP